MKVLFSILVFFSDPQGVKIFYAHNIAIGQDHAFQFLQYRRNGPVFQAERPAPLARLKLFLDIGRKKVY